MMPWMFFLFGLVSMTGQMTLMREILVIFHGTEISIGIFFCVWLGGIGLGAVVGARLVRRPSRDFSEIFLHSFVGLGFSLILHIVLIRTLPFLLGASPAELAPLNGILVAVPVGIFFSAFLTGFLFPAGCKAVPESDDRFIARLYVFEAMGGLVGGVVFTFVLVRLMEPHQVVASTSLLLGTAALGHAATKKISRCVKSSTALLISGALLLAPTGQWLSDWANSVRWGCLHPGLELMASRPTRYQQVDVARLGKQYSLFGNSKIISSFPDPHSTDRLAALIMAEKPDARSFLIIGGGIGGLVGSFLNYPVEHLDVIEPDPQAFALAERFFDAAGRQAMADPRVRMIFRDGRFYVNRVDGPTYDTVICMVPDPVSSFWNRYFTLEFFRAVARSLRPNGIFVTGVTSAENFWGTEVASYAGSVYWTLKKVFPSVLGTPGDHTMFFAAQDSYALTLDPAVLKERFRSLGSSAFDPTAFAGMLPPEKTSFVMGELEKAQPIINLDFAPVSSSLAMILWGRYSGTEGLEVLNTIRRGGLTVFLIPIALFVVASMGFRVRKGPREGAAQKYNVVLAMAAVGAAAMGTQIILIYGYQSLFGYVFERIGFIAAIFMIGLAAGGQCGGAFLSRIRSKERALVAILFIFSSFCAVLTTLLELIVGHEPWLIEAAIWVLVFASGCLTGVVFPLVAARHMEVSANAGESSGWTDAADHLGAAAGAAITGVLLVPLLGMERACTVLALVLLTPAAMLASEWILRPASPWLGRFSSMKKTSFPYERLSWALAAAVAAAMVWHIVIGPPGRTPLVKFPEETLSKLSGSDTFAFSEIPYPHYLGQSSEDATGTVTLSTMPVAGDVRGYGGPINLIVSVTQSGVIRGIGVAESRETPSYIGDLDHWLDRFKGQSILNPKVRDVDALSGATITSRAITEILGRTGERIADPILGLKPPSAGADQAVSRLSAFGDTRVWVVLMTLVVFVAAFFSRSRRLRTACLATGLMTLGFYLNAPFTGLDVAAVLNGQMPAPGTLWRNALFLAVLVISFLWGQAFCGFLCPFGALQEFLSVKALRRSPSPRLEQDGRYVKFVLLSFLMVMFLVTDDALWFQFTPLEHFFGGKMNGWVLALSLVCLASSVVYFRFWCRYLCPAGAFLALFNRLSILGRWAPHPIPRKCDLGVTSAHDVDCIKCHRCLYPSADETSERTK